MKERATRRAKVQVLHKKVGGTNKNRGGCSSTNSAAAAEAREAAKLYLQQCVTQGRFCDYFYSF